MTDRATKLRRQTPTAMTGKIAKTFTPQGVARELFDGADSQAPELLLSGPAGSGKSRACLEKMHVLMYLFPGARGLIVRKTRSSLTNTGIVTFEQFVLPPGSKIGLHSTTQSYQYTNGSVIVVGGMDKASKIMSAEYDIIFVQEATELSANDWESLLTRLRNGVIPYQQIIGDCNPQAPSHYIYQRSLPYFEIDKVTGHEVEKPPRLIMKTTSHEDNPRYYDLSKADPSKVTDVDNPLADPGWTEQGRAYLRMLDNLTGVRKDRLRWGKWTSAEGVVYVEYEPKTHLVNREVIIGQDDDGHDIGRPLIQKDWRRYWVVDFGFNHPFVWQAFAEDHDGNLYRYHEIYMTSRLVEDHAKQILEVTKGEPLPEVIICDHDREDRATLERYLGMRTTAAWKHVKPGIQAVQVRMKHNRLFLLRDSLVEVDKEMLRKKKPINTEQELESYVWNSEAANLGKQEEPIKEDDHGCFVASTPVHTLLGPRPIESIKVGDFVFTRQGYRPVTNAMETCPNATVYTLTLWDGRTITATGNHPFYNSETHTFVRLDQLRVNDILIDLREDPAPLEIYDNGLARVMDVIRQPGEHRVYNLTVEGEHEFFVNGILVKNCDCLRYMVAFKDCKELATGRPAAGGHRVVGQRFVPASGVVAPGLIARLQPRVRPGQQVGQRGTQSDPVIKRGRPGGHYRAG